MKLKLPVKELRPGMFVEELDRPWLESPFLFQGFLVETQEELGKLQGLCDWVVIDRDRSVHESVVQRVRTTVFGRERRAHPARSGADPQRIERVRESFRNLRPVYQQIERGMFKVLDDRRLGRMVEPRHVRAAITQLLHNILQDVNASLWLTKVRATDEHSAVHAINVAILSMAFARHLGQRDEMLEAIGLGALLHDVGLTERSAAIVRKRRPLTADEFAVIKRHPLDGLYAIRRVQQLPAVARDIIRWHHERLDGRGYPDGLSGKEIPLHVRMVAVADAYDAMVSDRVYRPGLLPSHALGQLHRMSTDTFGRELVQDFIRCIGIYPVGSTVRLSTGAIAMVVSSEPEARLTPVVLVLRDSDGREVSPCQLVDLANTERKLGERWQIREMVNPAAYGIDVAAMAAEEGRTGTMRGV